MGIIRNDAISRQEVNKLQKYRYNCGDAAITCVSLKSINELPPVNPQFCDDVLDKIRTEIDALLKVYPFVDHCNTYVKKDDVLKIIDKYIESEK